MARPAKPEWARQSARVTLYLRPDERRRFGEAARTAGMSLNAWAIAAMEAATPPKPKALEDIMAYTCTRCGETFWLPAAWPSPPLCCPLCGAREPKDTRRWATAVLGWRR